jgi:hypothetical protein
MGLEPSAGRIILKVILRKERLPRALNFVCLTFRRPHTEVTLACLVCPLGATEPYASLLCRRLDTSPSHYHSRVVRCKR